MDEVLRQFIELLDRSITLADEEIARAKADSDAILISEGVKTSTFLKNLREDALTGRMPRPSKGVGFGLTRAVGEWAEGSELLKAVAGAEGFYCDHM